MRGYLCDVYMVLKFSPSQASFWSGISSNFMINGITNKYHTPNHVMRPRLVQYYMGLDSKMCMRCKTCISYRRELLIRDLRHRTRIPCVRGLFMLVMSARYEICVPCGLSLSRSLSLSSSIYLSLLLWMQGIELSVRSQAPLLSLSLYLVYYGCKVSDFPWGHGLSYSLYLSLLL